jgi:hypothetical protein
VCASDDFKVMAVHVTIFLPDRSIGEQCPTTFVPGSIDEYTYVATTTLAKTPGMKVIVAAKDKQGNLTTRENVF